jgi:hypothetical protein
VTAARTDFSTIELVRFVLARIDDEEQVLRKVVRRTHKAGDHEQDPAFIRARSEIITKRQVLGHVQHLLVLRDLPSEKVVRDLSAGVLQAMARPYADHVQYRPIWQPA